MNDPIVWGVAYAIACGIVIAIFWAVERIWYRDSIVDVGDIGLDKAFGLTGMVMTAGHLVKILVTAVLT